STATPVAVTAAAASAPVTSSERWPVPAPVLAGPLPPGLPPPGLRPPGLRPPGLAPPRLSPPRPPADRAAGRARVSASRAPAAEAVTRLKPGNPAQPGGGGAPEQRAGSPRTAVPSRPGPAEGLEPT